MVKIQSSGGGKGRYNQCDQIARLFVKFLPIFNNENLPNFISFRNNVQSIYENPSLGT